MIYLPLHFMAVTQLLNGDVKLHDLCTLYSRPSIYRAHREKGNMHGISNLTVNRILIYISVYTKVAIWENENRAR